MRVYGFGAALVAVVCCSCASPYERLRDKALMDLECEPSHLMVDWPRMLITPDSKLEVTAVCWPAPLDTFGPGPGMPPVHATAWANYVCPSHEVMNSVRGFFFGRCEKVAHGLGDPP